MVKNAAGPRTLYRLIACLVTWQDLETKSLLLLNVQVSVAPRA